MKCWSVVLQKHKKIISVSFWIDIVMTYTYEKYFLIRRQTTYSKLTKIGTTLVLTTIPLHVIDNPSPNICDYDIGPTESCLWRLADTCCPFKNSLNVHSWKPDCFRDWPAPPIELDFEENETTSFVIKICVNIDPLSCMWFSKDTTEKMVTFHPATYWIYRQPFVWSTKTCNLQKRCCTKK